jgi:hypothetical protein
MLIKATRLHPGALQGMVEVESVVVVLKVAVSVWLSRRLWQQLQS